MWPRTSWPLSSFTLNIVLGRASETALSISILSSLLKLPLCARPSPRGLKLGHIDGLGTLVPGLLVVGHFRVLLQRLEAAAVDARVMHEKVSVALVGRYEPVALLVVEPLDRTGGHALALPLSQPHRSPARSLSAAALCSGFGPDTAAKSTTLRGWRERSRAKSQRPWKVALPGPSSRNERTAFCRSSVAKSGAAISPTRSSAPRTPCCR